MNLILCGFPGSGKTKFGKKSADKLGIPFVDTDQLIGNPRILYKELGEKAFRLREKEAIFSFFFRDTSIIATGGGSFCQKELRNFFKRIGRVVFLCTSMETAYKNAIKNGLPAYLSKNDPWAAFSSLYVKRSPIYTKFSDYCINADLDSESIVQSIVKIFYEANCHE
jgi:shikimate kinase